MVGEEDKESSVDSDSRAPKTPVTPVTPISEYTIKKDGYDPRKLVPFGLTESSPLLTSSMSNLMSQATPKPTGAMAPNNQIINIPYSSSSIAFS